MHGIGHVIDVDRRIVHGMTVPNQGSDCIAPLGCLVSHGQEGDCGPKRGFNSVSAGCSGLKSGREAISGRHKLVGGPLGHTVGWQG